MTTGTGRPSTAPPTSTAPAAGTPSASGSAGTIAGGNTGATTTTVGNLHDIGLARTVALLVGVCVAITLAALAWAYRSRRRRS